MSLACLRGYNNSVNTPRQRHRGISFPTFVSYTRSRGMGYRVGAVGAEAAAPTWHPTAAYSALSSKQMAHSVVAGPAEAGLGGSGLGGTGSPPSAPSLPLAPAVTAMYGFAMTLVWPVVYRSSILGEAIFARWGWPCTLQSEARSYLPKYSCAIARGTRHVGPGRR